MQSATTTSSGLTTTLDIAALVAALAWPLLLMMQVPEGWELLPATHPPKIEHAVWLTAAALEQMLGSALERSSLNLTELQRSSDLVAARLLASQPNRWVALTRDDRVFDRLVDRAHIIQSIARNCVRSTSDD